VRAVLEKIARGRNAGRWVIEQELALDVIPHDDSHRILVVRVAGAFRSALTFALEERLAVHVRIFGRLEPRPSPPGELGRSRLYYVEARVVGGQFW